jgi:putative effector of murein hydrolase
VTLHLAETWQWLVGSPLFGITLTLVAYQLARRIWERTGRHASLNPVLVAIVLTGGTLLLLGVDYAEYMAGGQYLALLLGPATVALALPLHWEARLVRASAGSILTGLVAGSAVSIVVAFTVTQALSGDEQLALSMAPKSATTPVSIALAESAGGLPALTAVFTILAGVLGAVLGPAVLSLVRVRDLRSRGLAIGAASHGIGTSRAPSPASRWGSTPWPPRSCCRCCSGSSSSRGARAATGPGPGTPAAGFPGQRAGRRRGRVRSGPVGPRGSPAGGPGAVGPRRGRRGSDGRPRRSEPRPSRAR